MRTNTALSQTTARNALFYKAWESMQDHWRNGKDYPFIDWFDLLKYLDPSIEPFTEDINLKDWSITDFYTVDFAPEVYDAYIEAVEDMMESEQPVAL